ncbi:helix-turn-helix domain-containing protein [Histidinibacterium aquaticum]|uniref:ImmA/IrrE family metallo-endopeptidase n=1 Tax=Histidinibacterium aquaticum TaxID=2613962 RepID=A0A5J5GQK4_9RHOB|nr:XRE family transcriptional regulator [Histidinibacterium aquaticum]KAA9010043.1 ImmA/IrrE family metallo-endopeptidase [Histidinibacterium aquaticum]
MFSSKRLSLARKRRRLTAKMLAEKAGVSPVTITRLENGQNEAEPSTVERLAENLHYPVSFFYKDDPSMLSKDVVSFRSLKSMSAREREAALGAGEIGVEVYGWVRTRFNLPDLDLPDFDPELTPEAAAEALRQHWGLRYSPVSNMLKLLEAKGIRVLGLEERTAKVDAFSFWQDGDAYVFLNSFKSAERSVFDAAHELGHLVLHKHGETSGPGGDTRTAEQEANRFASSFLMPEEDVRSKMPRIITTDFIIRAKKRWRVSAMALAYRLYHLDRPLLTEWQYRSICMELGKRGYRTREFEGIDRETSVLWGKVLAELWSERKSLAHIAEQIDLPADEVEMLFSGILPRQRESLRPNGASRPKLRTVK